MNNNIFKDPTPSLAEFIEKALLAVIAIATVAAAGQHIAQMVSNVHIHLADLFLLFIYAEVIGMVGAFYASHRIPVTLPIIIAMTALTRMIVLQSKELEPVNILYESLGIFILAVSAYIMSLKDSLSLRKTRIRKSQESSGG